MIITYCHKSPCRNHHYQTNTPQSANDQRHTAHGMYTHQATTCLGILWRSLMWILLCHPLCLQIRVCEEIVTSTLKHHRTGDTNGKDMPTEKSFTKGNSDVFLKLTIYIITPVAVQGGLPCKCLFHSTLTTAHICMYTLTVCVCRYLCVTSITTAYRGSCSSSLVMVLYDFLYSFGAKYKHTALVLTLNQICPKACRP